MINNIAIIIVFSIGLSTAESRPLQVPSICLCSGQSETFSFPLLVSCRPHIIFVPQQFGWWWATCQAHCHFILKSLSFMFVYFCVLSNLFICFLSMALWKPFSLINVIIFKPYVVIGSMHYIAEFPKGYPA